MVAFVELIQPLIITLNNFGGSGHFAEIYEDVVEVI